MGWREDTQPNAMPDAQVTPSVTYMTSGKTYYAVYSFSPFTPLTLTYDANGGKGAPGKQTADQYAPAAR